MTRKNKTIISSIIILLIFLLAIYLIMRAYQPVSQRVSVNNNDLISGEFDDVFLLSFDEEELSEKEELINNLKSLSFNISEKFGSYSYDDDYGNINELRSYMTDSMQEWADEYIEEERKEDYIGEYNSINTNSLAAKVIKLTEDEASVLVLTERKVLTDTGERNFQQHIIINFNKVEDDWKVDGILWL